MPSFFKPIDVLFYPIIYTYSLMNKIIVCFIGRHSYLIVPMKSDALVSIMYAWKDQTLREFWKNFIFHTKKISWKDTKQFPIQKQRLQN